MSLQYVYTIPTAELVSFTMPQGFQSNVQVYLWGAGGGGAPGAGGGFASSSVIINAGDFVQVDVGGAGTDGSQSTPGIGGASNLPSQFSGGNGGSGGGDEDGEGGCGGGGGAATAVIVNGIPLAVAAGGGGGGGYGDDGSAGYGGLPGGVQAQPIGWYPVSDGGAWCSFLNTYGIWTGGGGDVTTNTYQTIINFPTTSGYTFYLSTDNYGTLSVDGNIIVTSSSYTSVASATTYISAGTHTVTLSITNTGGPAGIGAQILNPDTTELWNSRSPVNFPSLNITSLGSNGGYGCGGGGGGGGGIRGGLGGPGSPDDSTGGYGGSGGLNLGQITIPGSGIQNGGIGQLYVPSNNVGWAGYPGYAVLVFTRKFSGYIKESGTWDQIQQAFIKSNGVWAPVTQAFIKNNGTWTPIVRQGVIAPALTFTDQVTHTVTVPTGVSLMNVYMAGGGGGGGGNDSHAGYPGFAGSIITGNIAVNPGDIVTVSVGSGGGGGGSGQSTSISSPGQYNAIGGISTLGYVGGRGGYPGGSGWSGEGGGGGAATVIQINGTTVAVAAGGGGGGGGGNYSNGLGQSTPSHTAGHAGGNGIDHSGDGGGSGGGGGGNLGGSGGPTVGGDNGGYSGSNGTNLVPSGWLQTSANNGGALYVAGGSGIAIISF